MKLHLDYEKVDAWPLKRIDVEDLVARRAGMPPKSILKADKAMNEILLNGETRLIGVPAAAWGYKLGVRSALEWILDQYSEGGPRDEVVRQKFNTYEFSNYKKRVIDLISRVTRVSVETQRIVAEMETLPG